MLLRVIKVKLKQDRGDQATQGSGWTSSGSSPCSTALRSHRQCTGLPTCMMDAKLAAVQRALQDQSKLRLLTGPIAVQGSVGAGIGVFTTKDVKAGSVLLHERPLSAIAEASLTAQDDELEFAVRQSMRQAAGLLQNFSAARLVVQHLSQDPQVFIERGELLGSAAKALKQRITGHDADQVDIDFLTKLLAAIQLNSFHLKAADGSDEDAVGSYVTCLFGGFFNHSCRPNACHYHGGPTTNSQCTLVIRAVTDIPAGQEVFISYLPELMSPKQLRRNYLAETYMFQCECLRCAGTSKDTLDMFLHPPSPEDKVKCQAIDSANDAAQSGSTITETVGYLARLLCTADDFLHPDHHWVYTARLKLAELLCSDEEKQFNSRQIDVTTGGLVLDGDQYEFASKLWAAVLEQAEREYPQHWPALGKLYKGAANAAMKSAGPGDFYDELRTKFNENRQACRGRACDHCQRFLISEKTCPKCRKAFFCSQECFKKTWKSHKKVCQS